MLAARLGVAEAAGDQVAFAGIEGRDQIAPRLDWDDDQLQLVEPREALHDLVVESRLAIRGGGEELWAIRVQNREHSELAARLDLGEIRAG